MKDTLAQNCYTPSPKLFAPVWNLRRSQCQWERRVLYESIPTAHLLPGLLAPPVKERAPICGCCTQGTLGTPCLRMVAHQFAAGLRSAVFVLPFSYNLNGEWNAPCTLKGKVRKTSQFRERIVWQIVQHCSNTWGIIRCFSPALVGGGSCRFHSAANSLWYRV